MREATVQDAAIGAGGFFPLLRHEVQLIRTYLRDPDGLPCADIVVGVGSKGTPA